MFIFKASDDLRDKLSDLNEKCKDFYSNSTSNMYSSAAKLNLVNNIFKDILNVAYNDVEYAVNFNSSLSDLAVCVATVFRNDFTNNILPTAFYSNLSQSLSGSGSVGLSMSFSRLNDIDLILGALLNSNYIQLINETIAQRPIFNIFKELSNTTNQSNEREVLIHLLNEVCVKQNRVGYYFLYYMYSVMIKVKMANYANSSSPSYKTNNNELLNLVRIYKEFMQERAKNAAATASSGTNNNGIKQDNSEYEKVSSSSTSSASSTSASSSNDEQDDAASNGDDIASGDKQLTESEISLGNCLMHDLRLCQQDDPYLFCFLLPFILSEELLPSFMINNSELVYLIVSCIDSRQLKDLVSSVISQDLILLKAPCDETNFSKKTTGAKNSKSAATLSSSNVSKKRKRKSSENSDVKYLKKTSALSQLKMSKSKKQMNKFKKETLVDVLNASLQWETIEQIFFWEVLMAHDDIDLNYLLPIFNRLDSNKHSEAICYLFQLIKSSEPTFDLVKYVVQRREEDNLARALLINWCKRSSSAESAKMIQIFTKLLNKAAFAFNSSQNQQHPNQHAKQESQSTFKKITLGSGNANNKVKLIAQQQLEEVEKQKRLNAQQNLNASGNILLDVEDLNKMPSLDQVN